ncbi:MULTISPECIES: plasmid mobilization protein [Rhodonellum]|nr:MULTISPECIES: ribbon-helix-helix protein, CopG family [Rhodonellum]
MKKEKENRAQRITVRLTCDEIRFLDEFSESSGLSRSEILRNLIRKIQGDVTIVKTDKLLKVLVSLAAEQGRVNNNINQLAKHANQDAIISQINPNLIAKFNLLLAKYLEYQESMNKTLKGIYKTIS